MYFHLHNIFHQHLQYGLPGLQAEVRQRETTDHVNKTGKDLLNLSFPKRYQLAGPAQRNVHSRSWERWHEWLFEKIGMYQSSLVFSKKFLGACLKETPILNWKMITRIPLGDKHSKDLPPNLFSSFTESWKVKNFGAKEVCVITAPPSSPDRNCPLKETMPF